MDALPDATQEDVRMMPDVLFALHKWALASGKKESTVKAYITKIKQMFARDGKSLAAMASEDYIGVIRLSDKSRTDHGQGTAAMLFFRAFWAQRDHSAPLEHAGDKRFFRPSILPVRLAAAKSSDGARPNHRPLASPPERGAAAASGTGADPLERGVVAASDAGACPKYRSPADSPERGAAAASSARGRQSRRSPVDPLTLPRPSGRPLADPLALPSPSDRPPAGAQATMATAPAAEPRSIVAPPRVGVPTTGGSGHRVVRAAAKLAVRTGFRCKCCYKRICGQSGRAASAPASPPTRERAPSAVQPTAPAASALQPPQPRPAAPAPATPPCREPAAEAKQSPVLLRARSAASQLVERSLVPLARVLQMLRMDSLDRSKEVLLFHGRSLEARNAQRIHGIYQREAELHHGRPVWQKVASERTTILCYSEETNAWRVTISRVAKGDFARMKDAAPKPWEARVPWRVFDGEVYTADPHLQLLLLDSASIPALQVEVPGALAKGARPCAPPGLADLAAERQGDSALAAAASSSRHGVGRKRRGAGAAEEEPALAAGTDAEPSTEAARAQGAPLSEQARRLRARH